MNNQARRLLTALLLGVSLTFFAPASLEAAPKSKRTPLGGYVTSRRTPGGDHGNAGTPPHNHRSATQNSSSGPSSTLK